MNLRYLIVLLSVVFAASDSVAADESDQLSMLNNTVCGPRCVQRILYLHGQNIELLDLIQELQWPSLNDGTTFNRMVTALEARGFHVRQAQKNSLSDMESHYPAIAFVSANQNPAKVPHFVVLERDQAGVKVWDGINGHTTAIDVTGDMPILQISDKAFAKPPSNGVYLLINAILLIGVGLSMCVVAIRRSRTQASVPEDFVDVPQNPVLDG